MANGNGSSQNSKELHVVMFPWLAFGHILPFYHLSISLLRKGHKITFISTPRNIDRLQDLPLHFASSMTFMKLPLPKVEGLPQNAEATMDIKAEDMDLLKMAFDGMEDGLSKFLQNSGADVIIYDFAAHWVPPIADALGISCYLFWIFNAWFLSFFGDTEALLNGLPDQPKLEDFLVPPKWVMCGSSKLAYKRHEAEWVYGAARTNASGCSDGYRVGKCIAGSNALIIRHCYEFEPVWLSLLEELHQKKVIPLGLMPPQIQETQNNESSWDSIKNWLGSKTKGSVVYVALGSEVQLSGDQMRELAHGLELSELPFLWALRKPVVDTEEDQLPQGFETRTQGRGIVWRNWVPQLEILRHDSIGAFLTHSGWSSIVEGLMFGVPLVLLPFVVDQGLNARVLADNMAGVEVPRDEKNGMFTGDGVAKSVRTVMVEEMGQKVRDRARELSAVFGDREMHERYVEGFVDYLEKHILEKKYCKDV